MRTDHFRSAGRSQVPQSDGGGTPQELVPRSFGQGKSIRHKLVVMSLITGFITLLLAFLLFSWFQLQQLRDQMAEEISTLGMVLGANAEAALAFKDREDARQVLSALSHHSSLELGCLFTPDGELLAEFRADDRKSKTCTRPISNGVAFREDHLEFSERIILGERTLGFVGLQIDLQPYYDQVQRSLLLGIVIIVVALGITYGLIRWLQKGIVVPLQKLTSMTRALSEGEDYSQRADARGYAEVELLSQGFNAMLAKIQERAEERDGALKELSESQNLLEQRVIERTEALEQANASLQEAKLATDAASQAKSMFLANMSHELRTPLNSILGFSNLLGRSPNLTGKERDNLLTIHRSGEHLLGLINEVLEVAKIESGKVTLNLSMCDLGQVLNNIINMFRPRIDEKGLTFILERKDNVPQFINADIKKLEEILINILGNAVKFTDEGEITLRVWSEPMGLQEVKPLDSNDLVRLYLEVEDTGCGIAQEELSQVFTAFEQTASGRKVKEGTGLGMAITKAYVEQMGGTIEVRSRVGQWTIFTIRVPVEMGKDFKDSDQAILSLVSLPADQMGRYRVLIADDVPENRELLLQLVGLAGFQVREAVDGRQALELFHDWEPHLVFLDLKMPDMDGIEVTKAIRATVLGRDVPIVVVSAHVMGDSRQSVEEAGADGFLSKPIQEAEILQCLKKLLGVTFVNKLEIRGGKPEPKARITAEALHRLPQGVRDRLRRSVILGDMTEFFAILENLDGQDSELIQALRGYGEEYQLDTLQELFGEASPFSSPEARDES